MEISNDIRISLDHADINVDKLHSYLVDAYWCHGIPQDIMEISIQNSVPFSLLHTTHGFIGFARLVTDHTTFAYLCDVIVDEKFRRQGLGRLLVEQVNEWIEDRHIRTSLLLTRDAQDLYSPLNWIHFKNPNHVMRYKESNPNFYERLLRR